MKPGRHEQKAIQKNPIQIDSGTGQITKTKVIDSKISFNKACKPNNRMQSDAAALRR
jgi:hypothetical protein